MEFGFGDFETVTDNIEIKKAKKFDRGWSVRDGGSIHSIPLLVNNMIIFGSADKYVYSIDAKTGNEIWKYRTDGQIFASSPAYSDGSIFIGSYDGYFYALNKKTGHLIWRFKSGGEIFNETPFNVYDNIIYVASNDNFLYALEVETGKELWRFKTGKYGNSCSVVIYKNILYHQSRDGILYAITMSGHEIWRFHAGSLLGVEPRIYDDRIYIDSEEGYLFCLNLNGNELWRFRTNAAAWNPPLKIGNILYFTSMDCHLYAIDADTHEEIWRMGTSSQVISEIGAPYAAWGAVVKKSAEEIETMESEDGYQAISQTLNLSEYGTESEYISKSEYAHKSEYSTEFVTNEDITSFSGLPHNIVFIYIK